jgi:L-amino acid N-acyltransferase YncA
MSMAAGSGHAPVIRPVRERDAEAIAQIYNHHVLHTVVTFEEEPVVRSEMVRRIAEVSERLPWLVCEANGTLAGYAYAAPWKARSAYRFTVETTIYLGEPFVGNGLGRPLYGALLDALRVAGYHAAIGCIALPNPASIVLHERLGFVKIGEFREVGWKLGRWVDVGYWQLRL